MKDVEKGFIAAVADAITKKTLERIHNMKEEVDSYLDKHLEDIILMGLGITREYGNKYKFERVNGFGGLLIDYITALAGEAAIERSGALLRKIVEERGKEILAKGAGDDACRIYADAYRTTLNDLVKEHLENNEIEFRKKLEPVVKETAMRLTVMSADHLKVLISSIRATNKAAK